jgi:hypothetical protein
MRTTLKHFDPAGPKRRPAFSAYRHIPRYVETMERVEAERDQMLGFVAAATGGAPLEIARNAADNCVSFDEALYLRWRYCRKQQDARERIAALRVRIGAGSAQGTPEAPELSLRTE